MFREFDKTRVLWGIFRKISRISANISRLAIFPRTVQWMLEGREAVQGELRAMSQVMQKQALERVDVSRLVFRLYIQIRVELRDVTLVLPRWEAVGSR